eukprot:UN23768
MLKTFMGCENLCMKLSHFTYHLIVACSEKKTLQFLLRLMENGCLIRDLTCASLYSSFSYLLHVPKKFERPRFRGWAVCCILQK